MITGTTLLSDKIVYLKPNLKQSKNRITKILGIDSEAYTTGEPFMFCTSNGDIILPKDLPGVFFEDQYLNANFMVYNLKYDSGALLYHLPLEALQMLWKDEELTYEGYRYEYINKKLLKIKQAKNAVHFWDIAQFYKSSLDNAAKTYLQKSKLKVRTKRFSPEYVTRNFHSIAKYCIQDATLTAELGEYLVNKLDEFGIVANKLYSCASISFKYFCENSKVVTAWRFWKSHKPLLQYACDAYEGGKFEVTARGNFPLLYEYDITSAYPYEIANLIDISKAEILYSSDYQKDAVYGYLRCYIDNKSAKHLPCGIKQKELRVYPAGEYHLTITKGEYDYISTLNIPIMIYDAVWLFVKKKRYPYRKSIRYLFSIKDKYKGVDKMLYNTTKIVMNSFYGKMAQCVEKTSQNKIILGRGWNPVYASEITANTRIKVTAYQNLLKSHCVAVHTDSIITDIPVDTPKAGTLGEFEFVESGPGIIIASGMYQINRTCALRGIIANENDTLNRDTWNDILTRFPGRRKIPYWQLQVQSWRDSMAKNHGKDSINVFHKVKKLIDLECDEKRLWDTPATSTTLLNQITYSEAKFHLEKIPPKLWTKTS